MPCFTNVLQKHCTGGDTYIKICPLQHNRDTDNMYMYNTTTLSICTGPASPVRFWPDHLFRDWPRMSVCVR